MSPEVLSLLGILIATALFIIGIFKGYHVTLVSIVTMAIVAIFSQVNILTALSDTWITKFAGVYKAYFLLFFFSALFAKSLGDVGAVQGIAFKLAKLSRKFKGHERLAAVLCLVVIQSTFTLGGISVFVVTFTVMYIAKSLFTELNVPWKLYTCGSLGTSTFTCAMFPGSPQLTNLIPMTYYNTPATAAPVLGIVCSIFCITLGVLWINRQVKKSEREGEGFEPSGTALLKSWDSSRDVQEVDLPLWKCLLPSIILFIVLNVLKQNPVTALAAGTLASYLVFNPVKQVKYIKGAAITAVNNANLAIVALASAAGFGGVVASVSGFTYILGGLDSIPGPSTLQVIIAVNVAAGFSASSSTGQKLALDMLSDKFLSYGIPNAALHRLTAMASVGLDTLPHSSALANMFYMTRLSYKDAYINSFMISVVITMATALFGALLIGLGLTF